MFGAMAAGEEEIDLSEVNTELVEVEKRSRQLRTPTMLS